MLTCSLCEKPIVFSSQRTTKILGSWQHRKCALKEIDRRLQTPTMSQDEIVFSQNGDRVQEAEAWLLSQPPYQRLFMVDAQPMAPKPAIALAYRGHGFVVRREDVLAAVTQLPRAQFVRILYGFLAQGLDE